MYLKRQRLRRRYDKRKEGDIKRPSDRGREKRTCNVRKEGNIERERETFCTNIFSTIEEAIAKYSDKSEVTELQKNWF